MGGEDKRKTVRVLLSEGGRREWLDRHADALRAALRPDERPLCALATDGTFSRSLLVTDKRFLVYEGGTFGIGAKVTAVELAQVSEVEARKQLLGSALQIRVDGVGRVFEGAKWENAASFAELFGAVLRDQRAQVAARSETRRRARGARRT